MRGPLVVLLAVVLGLVLLSRLRLGGQARWEKGALTVWLRIGPIRVRVWPMRKKKPLCLPFQDGKKPSAVRPLEKAMGQSPLELLEIWLPLVCEAAGRMRRAIRIDRLELSVRVGGSDPGDTALLYGRINTFLGMILPLFEHAFQVRKRQVVTSVDFDAETTEITFLGAASLTLGQLVVFTFWFLPEAIQRLGQSRPTAPSKEKEAINHGK